MFKIWIDICLLRAGPQDIPYSPLLLGLALAAYALIDLMVTSLAVAGATAVKMVLLDVAVMAVFLQLILQWYAKPARFLQTLTAMAGTGALLGLLAWPLIRVLADVGPDGAPPLPAVLLWLALLIWSLVVLGHILRHALGVSLPVGVALGVLYSIAALALVRLLFPAQG